MNEVEIPGGAAVFPVIPHELGVNPLLLAVLHTTVFLAGSDDSVIDADAAVEAMEYVGQYLHRLTAAELQRVREDISCLMGFAKREKWPKGHIEFLKQFLGNYGIDE